MGEGGAGEFARMMEEEFSGDSGPGEGLLQQHHLVIHPSPSLPIHPLMEVGGEIK